MVASADTRKVIKRLIASLAFTGNGIKIVFGSICRKAFVRQKRILKHKKNTGMHASFLMIPLLPRVISLPRLFR